MRIGGLGVAMVCAMAAGSVAAQPKGLRELGVLPTNSPADNAAAFQKAIDRLSGSGGAIFIDPTDEPYPIDGGIVLRRNVSLIGVHGPTARGTRHPSKPQPVGSVFRIEDEKRPFITVESATQIRGIQFWYPKQTTADPAKIVEYPPTIQVSKERSAQGVTLSGLTFYGSYVAMDFAASRRRPCELINIEHCAGYPLSGAFVKLDYCYDVPRLLHLHVNPAVQRFITGDYPKPLIDAVAAKPVFAYDIDHTDNAVLIDIFAFGVQGGVRLGAASYGQLTNFNLDCVTIGILKQGDSTFNRNWQIAQGSIIANVGKRVEDIHPIVIEGQGHTAISNVEAFSGPNAAITALGKSQDFLTVRGTKRATVSLVGCRMRNYAAASPINMENPSAVVRLVACFDGDEALFETTLGK